MKLVRRPIDPIGRDMRSVVDVLVGQIQRNDFAAVGVDPNTEFAPGTALRGPMLFKQPFAARALQPRAIDNQVQFAGSLAVHEPAEPDLRRLSSYDRELAIDIQHAHD